MTGGNCCIFVGRVMSDIDVRMLANGTKVVNFQLGVSEAYKDKSTGQTAYNNSYFKIEAWAKLADIVEQYVKKNTDVYVECTAKQDRWEKDGEKRSMVKFTANKLRMLSKKDEVSSAEPAVGGEADIPF